jgi:AbrB family looped-hinge helix DNA binding protein
MNAIRAKVSESGRLSLPAEFRKAIGLDHGGNVVVELDGRDIRIRTVDEVVARAQELSRPMLAGKPDVTVDDFIAERRHEAAKE